jgi:hypothetical protein
MSNSQARESDSSNDSREAFEAVMISLGCIHPLHLKVDADGDYTWGQTVFAWQVWQAAQSRHAAEREALVSSIKIPAMELYMYLTEARDGVRFKGEVITSDNLLSWRKEQVEKILALLDSGSKG